MHGANSLGVNYNKIKISVFYFLYLDTNIDKYRKKCGYEIRT